jgi:hypothetical protein
MSVKSPKVGADDYVAAGHGEVDDLPRAPAGYQCERQGDDYVLVWSDHKVRGLLTAIHENSDGIHAELSISHAGIDLHWGRLGLSSTQAREGVVRKLNGIVNDIPWRTILETTCRQTAGAVRRGDPTELLEGRRRLGPRLYVEPIVEATGVTVHYADGGSGKGYVALVLAIAAATGRSLSGGIRPLQPAAPVLYLDWESSKADIEHRLALLERGLGFETSGLIHYRRLWRPLTDEASHLRATITELGSGLVIVDSFGPACGAEPEAADSVIRTMNAMRSFPVPCLVTAHVSKMMADQKTRTRPFGSVFTWNLARSCWELKRSEDGPDGELLLGLYHTKVNEGRLRRPFGLRFRFDPTDDEATAVALEAAPLSAGADLVQRLALRQRILNVLAPGPLTTEEIAEATAAKEGQVAARLRELAKGGRVTKIEAGGGRGSQAKWALAAR